jgi:hypothetical protein
MTDICEHGIGHSGFSKAENIFTRYVTISMQLGEVVPLTWHHVMKTWWGRVEKCVHFLDLSNGWRSYSFWL